MKFGVRKPSLKKSLKARTTGKWKRQAKKAVIPGYGKKGAGIIKNPKKAVYNKVYNKTSFDSLKSVKTKSAKTTTATKKGNEGNGCLTLIKWFVILPLVLGFILFLSPFALIGGLIAFWYYSKKKPDDKRKKIALGLAIAGLIGTIILTPAMLNQENFTETTSSSSSASESSSSSSVSEESSSKKEESSSKPAESESETKNEKEFDESANQKFASYLMLQMNAKLIEDGVTDLVSVEYFGENLIYIILPQAYKYEPNVSIQELADSMLSAKTAVFRTWAIENGYDATQDEPILYMKAEDGTTLAEESAWSGSMKRKIDNS